MRILFGHQHLGASGGAEQNILLTASELSQRGHTIGLLYALDTRKDSELWQKTFHRVFKLPAKGNYEHVEAVMEEFKPDLVYLHNVEDHAVLEALLKRGLPVIRMVHDHSLYCLRSYKYNYFTRRICTRAASGHCVFPCLATVTRNRQGSVPVKWQSLAEKQREISLNRQFNWMVVYSDYSRGELINNGFDPDRIHVHVPIRCWGTNGRLANFSNRNRLLFAGQLVRGKGVDVLLKALKKVTAPFECVILGEGSHRTHCERLARKLGLDDRVRFEGYVPPQEMETFYLEASVFVMSSVWPEPFGMAGPEAMRYGLPVVAFDAGAIGEWLKDGDNGFMVPWMDTTAFAARIDALLGNKELARRLGHNGLIRVNRQYAAPRQVDGLERLFQSAISKSDVNRNESTPLNVVHGHLG